MTRVTYLGDETSGAGYRLAGAEALVPTAADVLDCFETALANSTLVLLSAGVAEAVGEARVRSAQTRLAPLVIIVPDRPGGRPLPDVAARLQAQLGLA